jgi:uncharacterized OB-fold protein
MQERPISDIAYNQYLSEDRLMGTRCKKCGRLYVPPRPICIDCLKAEMEWAEMSGRGKLAGFTAITIGPAFMREEGYDRKRPYCVGVVELEEGTRVDARIEGVDPKAPDTIRIGMPMQALFLHRGTDIDSRSYLAFEPEP